MIWPKSIESAVNHAVSKTADQGVVETVSIADKDEANESSPIVEITSAREIDQDGVISINCLIDEINKENPSD